MTSHPLPPHDDNDDLDLQALYRTLPRPEPSADLDAAVKQVAARAATADRKVQQSSRHRWHPGWSIAATVVLATSVFFLTDLPYSGVTQLAQAPVVNPQLAEPPAIAPSHAPSPGAALSESHPARTPAAEAVPPLPSSPSPVARQSEQRSLFATPTATRKQYAAPAQPRTDAADPAAHSPSANIKSTEQLTANAVNAAASAQHADTTRSPAPDTSATAEIPPTPEDIEARIARIRTLLQQGKQDQALQELRALKRDAPELTLPKDLRSLLPD